jgi:low molecular weight protein-tyrosine phosphatase
MPRLFSNPLRFLRPDRAGKAVERPAAVLLLCTGNVCRSPMAEALLRGLLAHRAPGTRVESAGLGAPEGQPADPHAVELLSERGLDISGHRARQVTGKMLEEFPVIFVMEEAQRALVGSRYRAARARSYRLGEWGDFDVPDPIGGERAEFEQALVLIDQGIADWLERLWPSTP